MINHYSIRIINKPDETLVPFHPHRVLVCGGRDFTDRRFLWEFLDRAHARFQFRTVIDGVARGVDNLAHEWSNDRGLDSIRFPADWKRDGMRAGMIRNKQMLKEGYPELGVSVCGGSGTAHMTGLMVDAGIPVLRVETGEFVGSAVMRRRPE